MIKETKTTHPCVSGATWDAQIKGWQVDCPFCGSEGSFCFTRLDDGWCVVCGERLPDEMEVIARVNKWTQYEAGAALWAALEAANTGKPMPTLRPPRPRLAEEHYRTHRGVDAQQHLQHLLDEAHPSKRIDEYLEFQGLSVETPDVLRLHLAFPYYNRNGHLIGTYPTILAPLRVAGNDLVALHLTHLDPVGPWLAPVKHPRWVLDGLHVIADSDRFPRPLTANAAVPLAPAGEHLGLCAGLENCLAIMQASKLPVWMLPHEVAMHSVKLPPQVRRVDLYSLDCEDLDAPWEAVYRLQAEGKEVRTTAPFEGLDYLGQLKKMGEESLRPPILELSTWERRPEDDDETDGVLPVDRIAAPTGGNQGDWFRS